MLRPSMHELLKDGENYYEMVVAIARKARKISEKAEADGVLLEEKPVTTAVNMFASGEEKLANVDINMKSSDE